MAAAGVIQIIMAGQRSQQPARMLEAAAAGG
jgi:hypothetical protein